MTEVLEVIPTHQRYGGDGGRMVVYESTKLMYHNIRTDHIANFSIALKTVNNMPLLFTECADNVMVNLLFREKRNQ